MQGMTLLDRLANRLGYVRKDSVEQISALVPEATPTTPAKGELNVSSPKDPEYWGFSSSVRFSVQRGKILSSNHLSFDEVIDFLDACGLDLARDEFTVAGIFAGVPFEIDDAVMIFRAVTGDHDPAQL
ncbi:MULTISPECIES: hypothetical protein [Herbaspirillum]|uniref:Uncharacterized protein n=2 Tax=Herbaspirillum huttiense TaxID=863372 RepID=A0AAJ2LRN6_9BURK|nr:MULTISPECIES: hypothetical protein [Herbaspirillum]MDR9836957.1 hypothetical protein [Herbaspirillum huttiense]